MEAETRAGSGNGPDAAVVAADAEHVTCSVAAPARRDARTGTWSRHRARAELRAASLVAACPSSVPHTA
eukprot:2461482-Rhodomonas_salina.1